MSTLDHVGAGRKGAAELRRWLRDRGAQASSESDLETRLVQFFRYSKVPKPVRQYWVTLPSGERVRLDFAYPGLRIAIECDGRDTHLRAAQFDLDHARRSALASMGWVVIVVTWNRLSDPGGLGDELNATIALRMRGAA
jgi:very-short-patch-repair endonuclease